MKRLLLSLFLGITFFGSNTQAQSTFPPLYLKNHTVHIQAGMEDLKFSNYEIVNGKIYRIIQESKVKYFKLGMKEESFEVLEYLPHNAFLVSINTSRIEDFKNILSRLDARVAKSQPDWKLSPSLFKSDIPEWAWIDSKHIKVWIQTYANIAPNQASQLIQNQGLEIIDIKPELQFYAISIKPENATKIAALPFVNFLQEMEDPGQIENHTARTNHRVNTLQSTYSGAPHYDGSGVTVGHGDDGALGDHIDYTGRLTQNAGPSNGDHGDHVAGTIFGAGNLDPKGRGMAPGAEIYYQSYPNNLNNVDQDFSNHNVRITSSSYSNGCNAGYTGFTRQMDLDIDDHNSLIHVFSAGNSGSGCSNAYVSGWFNVTGGHKIAKNVITVANLARTDALTASSSRGPAEDGRIKPDISAVGTDVYSTTDLTPTLYTNKTGTSMSCPGVSGTLAVLYEAYRDKVGGDPHASLLKGIALNTADDLGNAGPDFKFGYGRINARRAYNVIEAQNFMTDSITGTTKSFTINMPTSGTVKEVKIMLIWPDPAASLSAAKVLVNDLDLTASQGSTNYQPLVLDPSHNSTSLNAPAVPARDSLNNIEQIVISNPTSGNITVDVDAYNLPSSGQKFFIVYEFVMDEVVITYPQGGEGFVPFETEYIRWDASEGTGSFTIEYSTDNGATWTLINNASSSSNYFLWAVPNIPTNEAKIRVTRGSQISVTPGTFTIVGTPTSITFPVQCPDSLSISWNAVNGATGYVIYELGDKYMDSIGYSTTNSYIIQTKVNPSVSNWYSVAAVIDSVPGRRARAVEKPTGLINCTLSRDIKVSQLLSPTPGIASDCFDYDQTPMKVRLENNGINDVYNFDLSYKINNNTIVTDNVTDTIPASGSIEYSFSTNAGIVGGSNYYIDIWVDYNKDQNHYNDSLSEVVILLPGTSITPPYSQDFESFSTCATTSNCSQGECTLINGWANAENIQIDDIDWRVNSGSTPSSGTGPNLDANPGTVFGKYLYLEASGNCDSSEALLMSPCIDLTASISGSSASASFDYHMYGTEIGKLSVDIITQEKVILNAIPTINQDLGNVWNRGTVNLTPYIGEKIIVRFRGKTGDGYRSDIAIDNFAVSTSGVGLDENPLGKLELFPNPNTGVFTISLAEIQNGRMNFTVNSITGKQVYSSDIDSNDQKEFTLDLSHLPKGAYIVTVTTNQGSQNLSMMKQ